jgi:hypothetical protein
MSYSPNDVLSPVLLGVSAFTAFMPPISKIRRASESDLELVSDVHVAEITAGSVVVFAGLCIGMWSHEYYPMFIALLTVALMIFIYEYVLKMKPVV